MPRLLAIALCLLCAAPAGAAADAGAAAAPPAPTTAPAEVVRRFAAAIASGRLDASVCALLTRDLRDASIGNAWVVGDAADPASSTAEAQLDRACDAEVAAFGGWTRAGGAVPSDLRIGAVRTVARRGRVAHLRVETRQSGERHVGTVFVEREPDGWRLAWPGPLWALSPQPVVMPVDLVTFARHRRDLARQARFARRARAQLARGTLASRVAPAPALLPWPGALSRADDPVGDVADGAGARLADQASERVDVVAAALRLDRRTLMLELRFRDAVPDAWVELELAQNLRAPTRARPPRMGGVSARLNGGWANAWIEQFGRTRRPLPGLRAGVDGATVQLALPARPARGTIDLARRFRWSVTVRSTQSDATAAIDDIPQRPRAPQRGVTGALYLP